MVEDPKWELAILATVQGFYEKLLQDAVDGEVPVPVGLEAISLQQADGDVHETLGRMRRWLRLLDLAITPAMLRRGITLDTDPEIAEAMLRYFARKKDAGDVNRDKTDLIATFLYRHPRVAGQWERRGYGLDGALPLSPLEIALIEILADSDAPSLLEDHVQILRRFDGLQEEAESFSDLNALLDSGIISRVRELKQSLDLSFYHPGVLATIAPYNAAFGRKFDELFRTAAAEIREFADALKEQGGTILGNVDGIDVTVDHVASLQENELLKVDYGTALEKFRRVSRLKKVLASRPPMRNNAKDASLRSASSRSASFRAAKATHGAPAKSDTTPRAVILDLHAQRASVTPSQISNEEGKILRVEESIRVFVRVADPKFRQVVPMRFFNLILTPAEADAYCSPYLEESSFRADVARTLLRLVAVIARITTELEELKRTENSPSLWKLHADSLVVLLEIAEAADENASRLFARSIQDGEAEYAEQVQTSVQKLADSTDRAGKTLSTPKSAAATAAR